MGLKAGDLEDLVSNLLSIDEFESKIDNEEALVVGFKVADKEPAQDLSRFIEKSTVELMDTEVSPAPDTDGKYVVFIEFSRDKTFPHNLVSILKSMENLTNIKLEEYRFTAYKKKGDYEADEDTIRRKVRLKPKQEKLNTDELQLEAKKYANSISLSEAIEKLQASKKYRKFAGGNDFKKYHLNDWQQQLRESYIYRCIILEKFNDPELDSFIREYSNNLLENININTNKTYFCLEVQFGDTNWNDLSIEGLRVKLLLNLKKLTMTGGDLSKSDKYYTKGDQANNFFLMCFNTPEERESFIAHLSLAISGESDKVINANYKITVSESLNDNIAEFLVSSNIDTFWIEDNRITIKKGNKLEEFQIVDCLPVDKLFEKYNLDGIPFTMNEQARWHSRDMYKALGAGYATNVIKGFLLVSKADTNKALLLQDNS